MGCDYCVTIFALFFHYYFTIFHYLFPPSVPTNTGLHYCFFTPFWRNSRLHYFSGGLIASSCPRDYFFWVAVGCDYFFNIISLFFQYFFTIFQKSIFSIFFNIFQKNLLVTQNEKFRNFAQNLFFQ